MMKNRKEQYKIIFGVCKMRGLLVDFNERMFHRLVDYTTVYSDGGGSSAMTWKPGRRFKARSG